MIKRLAFLCYRARLELRRQQPVERRLVVCQRVVFTEFPVVQVWNSKR